MNWGRSRVAKRYNVNCTPNMYHVADTVLYMMMPSSRANNILTKFLLKWSIPVIIAKIVHPNVALLANSKTGVIIRRAHVSLLKPSEQLLMFCCV